MSVIQVCGLTPLKGEISIQGSKNAVLPMMAAAILHKGITVLTNVPMIQDVDCMVSILNYIGCRCNRKGSTVEIDGTEIECAQIPDHFVSQMRSSIIVLGALLGRVGEGESRYPGGCLIGARPIDIHLQVRNAWEPVSWRRTARLRPGPRPAGWWERRSACATPAWAPRSRRS